MMYLCVVRRQFAFVCSFFLKTVNIKALTQISPSSCLTWFKILTQSIPNRVTVMHAQLSRWRKAAEATAKEAKQPLGKPQDGRVGHFQLGMRGPARVTPPSPHSWVSSLTKWNVIIIDKSEWDLFLMCLMALVVPQPDVWKHSSYAQQTSF